MNFNSRKNPMENCFTFLLLIVPFCFVAPLQGASENTNAAAILADSLAPARTFFVDATGGSDQNDGLSPATAWKSLEKVNSASEVSGEAVRFKRGEIWRGQLVPRSGTKEHPTRYADFGSGAKPVIMGSVSQSRPGDWVNGVGHWMNRDTSNLWRSTTAFDTDVGNIIFSHGKAVGFKRWSLQDLATQGDFYYDRASRQLTLYSIGNPASAYKDVEVALRRDIVSENDTSFVIYDNLALKYGAAHGIGGTDDAFIAIRHCDISFIGGGDLFMDGSRIRYGNGIEFWANAHDCLVEGCRLWEIYDTGLTNQNTFAAVSQHDISYRNNLIWDCAYASFECWTQSPSTEMTNIHFENNTCAYAGQGWGKPPQRPEQAGYQLEFSRVPARISNVYVRNNIFYGYTGGLWLQHGLKPDSGLTLDHNCYYQPGGNLRYVESDGLGSPVCRPVPEEELHSLAADPLFVDARAENFHLRPGSPCIDAGLDVGSVSDFDGRPRPLGRGCDIGAYDR